MKRAAIWWKNHLKTIETAIRLTNGNEYEALKWRLIEREITMWIGLDKQIEASEFRAVCYCRGFSYEQKQLLKNALIYIGIGKHLNGDDV